MAALKHGIDFGGYRAGLNRLLRLLPVADFPMKNVVGLFLAILAQDGSARIESFVRIHQHRKLFVVHLDQLRHIGRGILLGGDAKRYFLRLEQNFSGSQHHLLVVEQGGHPREARCGEIGAGDYGQRAWHFHRIFDVDALQPRVAIGAADHVAENHPRQMHVVDVIALALNESRVLFAFDRVAHATDSGRCRKNHAAAPFCILVAAYRTAFTMF